MDEHGAVQCDTEDFAVGTGDDEFAVQNPLDERAVGTGRTCNAHDATSVGFDRSPDVLGLKWWVRRH
jgi:hypothetical protein